MRTQQIRQMIKKAIEDEESTGRLAQTLRTLVQQHGGRPTDQDIEGAVGFVRGYIEHVPHFLEQGAASAQRVGLGSEMAEMTRQLEAYWFDTDDVISDRLGLMGLMDDAYASLLLLQGVSDYCQASVGQPLLAENLTQANQAIRAMIGEPAASHLDVRVGTTIGQAMMQRVMGQFAGAGGFTFGGGPDPVWGGASMDEVVTARLGALGFVS